MSYKKWRKFGDRRYIWTDYAPTKADAKAYAKELRKSGYLVRIVKSADGIYDIYTAKKIKRKATRRRRKR